MAGTRGGGEEKRRVRCKLSEDYFRKWRALMAIWDYKQGAALKHMLAETHRRTFSATEPPLLTERVPDSEKRRVGCEIDEEGQRMWNELMEASRRTQGGELEHMIDFFYREEFSD